MAWCRCISRCFYPRNLVLKTGSIELQSFSRRGGRACRRLCCVSMARAYTCDAGPLVWALVGCVWPLSDGAAVCVWPLGDGAAMCVWPLGDGAAVCVWTGAGHDPEDSGGQGACARSVVHHLARVHAMPVCDHLPCSSSMAGDSSMGGGLLLQLPCCPL